MAIQISRSRRLIDTLELLDDNGAVAHTININLDISAITKEYKNLCGTLAATENQLNAAQKNNDTEAFDMVCTLYGNTIISLLNLIFGAANAQILLDFYENNYFEMSIKLAPIIFDVIAPKIAEEINAEKMLLTKQYSGKKGKRIRR